MAPRCLLGSPLISEGRERSLLAWRTTKASAGPSPKPLQQPELRFSLGRGCWLPNGGLFEITKVYPLDAIFDTPEEVPEDIKNNKRYAGLTRWTVQNVPKR